MRSKHVQMSYAPVAQAGKTCAANVAPRPGLLVVVVLTLTRIIKSVVTEQALVSGAEGN